MILNYNSKEAERKLKPLLSIQEYADLIRVNPFTVYDWLRNGYISGKKIGRVWRIRSDSLNDLLNPENTR